MFAIPKISLRIFQLLCWQKKKKSDPSQSKKKLMPKGKETESP